MSRALLAILLAAAVGACGESETTPDTAPDGSAPPPPRSTGPSSQADPQESELRRAAEETASLVSETVEDVRQQAEEEIRSGAGEIEQGAEEVSQEARQTMERYIADLRSLGDTLGGVDSRMEATTAAPKTQDLVSKLKEHAATLEALAPEKFAQLKAMYSEQLEPLVAKARSEIQRLTSDDSLAALRPMLEDLPLLGSGSASSSGSPTGGG